MRIPQLARASATAAVAALLLTACGGRPLDGKTGPEVAAAAADALEEAGSVQVSGTIEQDGEEGEVDLFLQGEDATGTLTMGGVAVELLSVGGQVYLRFGDDGWPPTAERWRCGSDRSAPCSPPPHWPSWPARP